MRRETNVFQIQLVCSRLCHVQILQLSHRLVAFSSYTISRIILAARTLGSLHAPSPPDQQTYF